MADNTTLDPGTGGDTIRDKDRAGVKTQVVALDLNPAGAESLMAGAMPVTDNGGSLTVDGTVGVSGTVTADTELTTADLDTGAGTDNRAVVGLVVAKSGGAANVSSTDPLPMNDAGGSLTVDAPVGTPVFVRLSDGSSAIATLPVSLASLPALAAGTNLVGRVQLDAATANGATPATYVSAASTNATSLKASAGQVYGVLLSNVNAAARYLKIFNKASAPTVGTDTPVMNLIIPGNTAGAGSNVFLPVGAAFSTGIAFAITTGVALLDTGAVAANEITATFLYA
jgi:hypothetical protein